MKLASLGIAVLLIATAAPLSASEEANITFDRGIIRFHPRGLDNGMLTRKQVGKENLWFTAVRKGGKTRQVRLYNLSGGPYSRKTVSLVDPFGEMSSTWNLPITKKGKIITATIPCNEILIGDLMDVNEDIEHVGEVRKKLALPESKKGLPVIYLSGDSISLCYWPYLEVELFSQADLYYQLELNKDHPNIKIRNNGMANLAYGVLLNAYAFKEFRPAYWLVNLGLHMIRDYHRNLTAYGNWLEKFALLAKEKKAELIFVNTTPYRQSLRPRQNETIKQFNKIMKEVAGKYGLDLIDLHAATLDAVKRLGDDRCYMDGVHFTEEVRLIQAAYIGKQVKEILNRKKGETAPVKESDQAKAGSSGT